MAAQVILRPGAKGHISPGSTTNFLKPHVLINNFTSIDARATTLALLCFVGQAESNDTCTLTSQRFTFAHKLGQVKKGQVASHTI